MSDARMISRSAALIALGVPLGKGSCHGPGHRLAETLLQPLDFSMKIGELAQRAGVRIDIGRY
ncbi:MAG: hypothetical protein H0T88_11185 [Lysobacter sp.]|nr:hypothetical protein [Lysobacter sp.]